MNVARQISADFVLKRYCWIFSKCEEYEIELFGVSTPIPEFEESLLSDLCSKMLDMYRGGTPVIDLHPPMVIIGDIHGNIHDLLRILNEVTVYNNQCVFLGDYVDRGSYSIDVLALLFALKLQYPDNVVLLRGNHEFRVTNGAYGFKAEIEERYGSDSLWHKFNEVFDYFPLAADVEGNVLLVHGGICPKLRDMQQVRSLKLPIETYEMELVSDLMWSDPVDKPITYSENERGKGKTFGSKAFAKFLATTQYKALVRGHQCVMNGIQACFAHHLWTVFSTSCYGAYANMAGILRLDASFNVDPMIWKPMRYVSRKDAKFCKGCCRCDIVRSGSVAIELSLMASRHMQLGSMENLVKSKSPNRLPGFRKSESVRVARTLQSGSQLPMLRDSYRTDSLTVSVPMFTQLNPPTS